MEPMSVKVIEITEYVNNKECQLNQRECSRFIEPEFMVGK